MKIRQIEIKDFGSIKNKTLKFTSGLNVLYDEKEQMREEVRTFIEKMLFGNAEFPYAGVLWFESGGRNYRLTRDLHRELSLIHISVIKTLTVWSILRHMYWKSGEEIPMKQHLFLRRQTVNRTTRSLRSHVKSVTCMNWI